MVISLWPVAPEYFWRVVRVCRLPWMLAVEAEDWSRRFRSLASQHRVLSPVRELGGPPARRVEKWSITNISELPDDNWDCVTAMHVLEHMISPSVFTAQLYRITKSYGLLYC